MFFRKKPKKIYPYVIDIGTREVRALSFHAEPETQNMTIFSIGSSKLPASSIHNGCIQDATTVADAIKNVLIEAKNPLDKHKNQPSLVVASSGIMVDTICSTVEYEREQSKKKIASKEWGGILEKIQSRINEEEYQSEKYYNMPMGLTQSSIERIAIDGEITSNIIKQKGSILTFDLFNSYVPETHLQKIIQISTDSNVVTEGVYHSMYGVTKLIIDNHSNSKLSMILIDIGESHTDVAVIYE
jgi:cell division ATPase FtsA